ncbi:PREDICTED: uncharacterized protein LOC104599650 isoform X1 [Nelumbo nucifera]|uniref:Uncharacterized protein LOC104599650 isoform X1 n=1 Tax=Nelumbo nucifera TaxID=4432 RepID=A0A1U8AFB8_NELNU|nr:PREDICTED: uncharacterized protein LOC104599650 isoform X1 [Nelumbo nucifera]
MFQIFIKPLKRVYQITMLLIVMVLFRLLTHQLPKVLKSKNLFPGEDLQDHHWAMKFSFIEACPTDCYTSFGGSRQNWRVHKRCIGLIKLCYTFQTSTSLKFTVLNPKGRIGTMVAGGGASVIYADIIDADTTLKGEEGEVDFKRRMGSLHGR